MLHVEIIIMSVRNQKVRVKFLVRQQAHAWQRNSGCNPISISETSLQAYPWKCTILWFQKRVRTQRKTTFTTYIHTPTLPTPTPTHSYTYTYTFTHDTTPTPTPTHLHTYTYTPTPTPAPCIQYMHAHLVSASSPQIFITAGKPQQTEWSVVAAIVMQTDAHTFTPATQGYSSAVVKHNTNSNTVQHTYNNCPLHMFVMLVVGCRSAKRCTQQYDGYQYTVVALGTGLLFNSNTIRHTTLLLMLSFTNHNSHTHTYIPLSQHTSSHPITVSRQSLFNCKSA